MSNTAPAVIVTNGLINDFQALPSPAALERKNELLELASLILSVKDGDEQADALDAASQIKTLEAGVEKSRKEIKAPVLLAGEAIDTAAKSYIKPLTAARLRIEGLLTGYALELKAAHEMAMEIQRAEEEEQRQEAAEANRKLQEEHNRKLAEAAAQNQPPPAPPVPVVVVQTYSPPPPPPKMEGASLKTEFDFEVTDVHKLYVWNRLYVKLEADRQNLKAYLNLKGVSHEIPGLRVFETNKTVTRTIKTKEVKVIE